MGHHLDIASMRELVGVRNQVQKHLLDSPSVREGLQVGFFALEFAVYVKLYSFSLYLLGENVLHLFQ